MKPFYTRSEIEVFNKKLQQSAQSGLDKHPKASFKELLAYSSEEVPELQSETLPLLPRGQAALREIKERLIRLQSSPLSGVGEPLREFLQPKQTLLGRSSNLWLKGFRLKVWGAGSFGLVLSYLFATYGAEVELHERRGGTEGVPDKMPLDACARTPNVSWKNFKQTLRPVLSPQDFDHLDKALMKNGAVVDIQTQKLRSTIGSFQETLYELCLQKGVKIYFNSSLNAQRVGESDWDLEVIATGGHAIEQVPHSDFERYTFEDGHNDIWITTTMYPCEAPSGFYREEWEEGHEVVPWGRISWRRRNQTVYPIETFQREVERFAYNLQRHGFSKQDIQKVAELQRSPQLAHVFYFGHKQPSYFHDVGVEGFPCLTFHVPISSWMLNRSWSNSGKLVFGGDATGSTHPLAAIGAYLSSKNAVELLKYACFYTQTASLEPSLRKPLLDAIRTWTESKMIQDRLMVFLQARLCSHYSR